MYFIVHAAFVRIKLIDLTFLRLGSTSWRVPAVVQ